MTGCTNPQNRINTAGLLYKLLCRGDYVGLEHGRLVIRPQSGNEVPKNWLKQHADQLVLEMANLTGQQIFAYQNYSTGRYGRHKSSGVCLHYLSADLQQPAFVIFNASLDRARSTKHGKAGANKKKGTFNVTKRHMFTRKWCEWGLLLPPRLSGFHDYMGRLKEVYLTGEVGRSNQFIKDSLKPAEIEHLQLLRLAGLDTPIRSPYRQIRPKAEVQPCSEKKDSAESFKAFLQGLGTEEPYTKPKRRFAQR